MRYPALFHQNYPASYEELRTPVQSLFDQLITDFFRPIGPLKEADVKSRSYPKVDVRKDENNLVFEAAVPFVKKEDLDITLEKNSLRISGKVYKDESIKEENFIKRELVRSHFARSFALDEVLCRKWEKEGGLITADLKEGLLTVVLHNFFTEKVEEPVVRKIAIS